MKIEIFKFDVLLLFRYLISNIMTFNQWKFKILCFRYFNFRIPRKILLTSNCVFSMTTILRSDWIGSLWWCWTVGNSHDEGETLLKDMGDIKIFHAITFLNYIKILKYFLLFLTFLICFGWLFLFLNNIFFIIYETILSFTDK